MFAWLYLGHFQGSFIRIAAMIFFGYQCQANATQMSGLLLTSFGKSVLSFVLRLLRPHSHCSVSVMICFCCIDATRGGHWGYAIPHFRNFSALFPQIRRRKLAISAILWDYEQSLPTSYKTQLNHFLFILHVTDQTRAVCSHHG